MRKRKLGGIIDIRVARIRYDVIVVADEVKHDIPLAIADTDADVPLTLGEKQTIDHGHRECHARQFLRWW